MERVEIVFPNSMKWRNGCWGAEEQKRLLCHRKCFDGYSEVAEWFQEQQQHHSYRVSLFFFHDTHGWKWQSKGVWDEMWWVMAGTWCSLLCGDKLMCGSCSRWMDGLMDMNSPHPLLLLLRYSSIIIQEPFVLWDSYGTIRPSRAKDDGWFCKSHELN